MNNIYIYISRMYLARAVNNTYLAVQWRFNNSNGDLPFGKQHIETIEIWNSTGETGEILGQ